MTLDRISLRSLAPWALVALAAACGGGGDGPASDGAGAAPDQGGGRSLSGGGPAGLSPHAEDQALARIDCAAASHEFGTLWQGAVVTHEFEFAAAGDTDLVIADYRPDCGCTVARLETLNADGTRAPYALKTPVPAGTRFALATSFDTAGREGHQTKTVRVYANVTGGAFELAFSADIKPLVHVVPLVGSIRDASVLERRELDFTLTGASGKPYRVTPLRLGLPDQLKVTAVPIEPEPDGRAVHWKVHAVLEPGMPEGIRSYEIQLQTDIEYDAAPPGPDGAPQPFVARAILSAVIAGLVTVEPQNLSFGMVAADETVARTLTVRSHDPAFELPEPTWEIKPHKEGASAALATTLHATARRAANGRDWELELLLDGLAADVPRSFLGRLVIATGHPRKPQLEVTLSGMRRGS
jgi:hypothetical protein